MVVTPPVESVMVVAPPTELVMMLPLFIVLVEAPVAMLWEPPRVVVNWLMSVGLVAFTLMPATALVAAASYLVLTKPQVAIRLSMSTIAR